MKKKIVLTREIPGDEVKRLESLYDVFVVEKGRPLNEEELRVLLEGCEVAMVMVTDPMNERTLKESRLKHLITYSIGVDHIDLQFLKSKKITLSHTPDLLTQATANLTWTLILGVLRRLKGAISYMESGKFEGYGPKLFLGLSMEDSLLGIIGMGKIGKAVSKRGTSFGLKIQYHSAHSLPRHEEEELKAYQTDFGELLRTSTIISLHCPLKPETRHLIGQRELEMMRRDAILINTARGAIIDEGALIKHLESNPTFLFGADVYEDIHRAKSDWVRLPNVLALPHIGSAEWGARTQISKICVDEAIRFAKGQNLFYEYPI